MEIKLTMGYFLYRKRLLLFIMRTFLFLFCSTVFALTPNNVVSQYSKIKIEADGKFTVDEIFDLIMKQTEYTFFYEEGIFKDFPKVQVQKGRISTNKLLKQSLSHANLNFEVATDNNIIISVKSTNATIVSQQNKEIQVIISGTVTDENNQPLPGANILEKGTTNGTQADFDGNFTISVENKNSVLVVSYVGFATREIIVEGQTTLTIALQESAAGLEEVVVVGYGSQKKVNLTGAIESVSPQEFIDRPIGDVSHALQGITPGLTVSQNNSVGQPGGSVNFNIRGEGTPLVLVDNLPVEINQINPQDIESVTVIKDASAAAIYGANAPYGVILITTKRGKSGKPQFSYNSTITTSSPVKTPEIPNSLAFAEGMNYASFNSTGQPFGVFSSEAIDRITQYINGANIPAVGPDPVDGTKWAKKENANGNTNWFDEVIRDNAIKQKHDISVNGGDEKSSYYASLGWWQHQGQLKYGNDSYNRYNIDAKIDTELTDWFKVGLLTKYSSDKTDFPSDRFNLGRSVMWHDLLRRWPTDPVKFPNGTWSEMSGIQIDKEGGRELDRSSSFWTKLEAEIEPLKDWKIYGDYGWNDATRLITIQHNTQTSLGPTGETYPHFDTPAVSSFVRRTVASRLWRYNIYSSYEKQFSSGHNFKLLAGYQRELGSVESLNGNALDLITPKLPTISTAIGNKNVDDEQYSFATVSNFGRFNYNFKEKYFLELNGNYQGTYKFARSERFGFFPSASVGYRISNENFWSDAIKAIVSNLKIRASYGELGNYADTPAVPQGRNAYLPNMTVIGQSRWIGVDGPTVVVRAPGIISPTLTWETIRTFDFGVEVSFLNNRLEIVSDYFRRGILDQTGSDDPLPGVLGTSQPLINNAESLNKGWELTIGWKDYLDNGLSYYVKGSITDYSTVIKKINAGDDPNVFGGYAGAHKGDVWGYSAYDLFQSDGEAQAHADQSIFWPTWQAGDVKYLDLNGDGAITRGSSTLSDHGDLSIIGNNEPRYIYNIQGGGSFKGFDLSFLFNGIGKRDVDFQSGEAAYWGLNSGVWQIYATEPAWNFWTTDNTNAKFPRPYLSGETNKNRQISHRSIENGAYLRLKQLQIGYILPTGLTEKVNVQKVRIFFNGENLLTFTKMIDTFDPESVQGDWGKGKSYPLQKSFSLGLNVNF